ncbi:unnamed protein product [Fraxinus pennsylvanica]|uniref:Uncharacterized protein n=1 Tax=Fraxinus pennsylvanica TaxID=56036 RepID=A0AAD1ZG87_9LAMI|nr:unnamed protein product [Fraxinus pennsylvanica]
METLISEFTFLSDQSLQNKNFDPSTVENLLRLFEVEAYKAWARVELQQEEEVEEAEIYMKKTEDYLDSVMESAMEEYRVFEKEMNRMAMAEHDSLANVASRKMGKSMKKAATFASNKYIEAAANSDSSSNSKKIVLQVGLVDSGLAL